MFILKLCFYSPKSYIGFAPQNDKCKKSVIGGSEIQINLLARELAADPGSSIEILVADYGQGSVEVVDSVRLVRSIRYGANLMNVAVKLFRAMRVTRAEIYLQRALSPITALVGLYAKLLGGKFAYMVAHDGETSQSGWVVKSRTGKITRWLAFKLADLVIVQNRIQQKALLERYPGKRNAILKKGLRLRESEGPDPADKEIDAVWVGRCAKFKNPEAFLALAKRLPSKSFLMIAPPALHEEGYFEQIKDRSSKIENLTFIGRLENEEVLRLMDESKLFCFTSHEEGDWPMTVLEAVSCGVPVVSLSLNYDGLIDDYRAGVFCGGDPEVMAEQIETICRDNKTLETMSRQAYLFARENLDIKKSAEKLLKILEGL